MNNQYYDHICLCGCNKQIRIKKYHKQYGIPLYISGHNKTKKNYKHGEGHGTKLYCVWRNIKERCSNLKQKFYKNYGGRGIIICPEWANDYIIFRDWALNNGYIEGLQINRINTNGNYEPSNCNFVTAKDNSRNRRSSKLTLEVSNEIRQLYKTGNYTQQELADKYGVSKMTIYNIIKNRSWI